MAGQKAVMRVYDVSGQGAFEGYNHNGFDEFEITFNNSQEHWLTNLNPGREYISQTGYYDVNGHYQSVALSNRIMTARDWEIKAQPSFGHVEYGYTPDPPLKHYRSLHDRAKRFGQQFRRDDVRLSGQWNLFFRVRGSLGHSAWYC